MKITYSSSKLQSRIWYSFMVLVFIGLFINIYNVTHMTGEFHFGKCNHFIDIFGNTQSGCFVQTPEMPLYMNIILLSMCLFWELQKQNDMHHFIKLTNIDNKKAQQKNHEVMRK